MGHVVKRQCRSINNKVNQLIMENNVSPEFLRQRRAVHHGLCSVLSEDEAITVLNQWVSHIGSSGSVFNGLNVFVRNVCMVFDRHLRARTASVIPVFSRTV